MLGEEAERWFVGFLGGVGDGWLLLLCPKRLTDDQIRICDLQRMFILT